MVLCEYAVTVLANINKAVRNFEAIFMKSYTTFQNLFTKLNKKSWNARIGMFAFYHTSQFIQKQYVCACCEYVYKPKEYNMVQLEGFQPWFLSFGSIALLPVHLGFIYLYVGWLF